MILCFGYLSAFGWFAGALVLGLMLVYLRVISCFVFAIVQFVITLVMLAVCWFGYFGVLACVWLVVVLYTFWGLFQIGGFDLYLIWFLFNYYFIVV